MSFDQRFPKFQGLDMSVYLRQTRVREKAIQASEAAEIKHEFRTNQKAKALHPDVQHMTIVEIIEHKGADAKTFVMKKTDGTAAAWFRAGQYVSVSLKIGDSVLTRPYSLCYSPKKTKDGICAITVRNNTVDGFASSWILSNWEVGTEVTISGPQGDFYYEPLRDRGHIVGLAGGSGITPFLAMANAVADGIEDMDITIIFGSRDEKSILFRKEFEALSEACPRIKVVHVLSDEKVEGYEHGFITADIIKKYGGEEASVFVCGPSAMFYYEREQLAVLGLAPQFTRNHLLGVTKTVWEEKDYNAECRGKQFKLTIKQYGKTYSTVASADEPILVAIERAGISAPSRCRSGECGWCRSKLLEGDVFIPEDNDGRRYADRVNGYIHPCSSFPVSDIVIEVPGSEFD